MSDDLLITSAYSVPLNGETPAEIMFFPAGKSKIRASVNGKPKEISVNVTQATASAMQSSLDRLLAEPVEPFIDFDHKSEAAAAVPKAFAWRDGEGVMLALDWTSAGKSAVEGKTYRYFSPTFLITEAGEPSSLPDSGPVGALVNNPAFRKMKRISAAEAAALTGDEEPPNTQKEKQMAEEANQETVMAALKTELEQARAENTQLRASAETARVESVNREADLLIEAAVREGKVAPKNEAVKASLKRWAVTDLAGAKAHIESLPVNAAFKSIVTVTSAHRDIGAPPKDGAGPAAANRGALCKAKVAAIQSQFPKLTFVDAWDKAKAEYPELFESVEA